MSVLLLVVTVDWLYNRSEVSVFTLIMYFLPAARLAASLFTVDCNTGQASLETTEIKLD